MTELKDLQNGQSVILSHTHRLDEVATIERLTKTQIITDGDERFNRETGYKIGQYGSFSRSSISVPKPGEIEKVTLANRRSELIRKFTQYNWKSLDGATLERVNGLLPKKQP